jgi:DNA-binding NarL/FixJ family response regulator
MSGDENKPVKKLETERGGSGGRRKTAVGTTGGGDEFSAIKDPYSSPPPKDRPRTVICDKDDTIRLGLKLMLKNVALVIGETNDGKVACELISNLRPDLLLIDMDLETQTGLDVLKSQQKELQTVKILISTDVYFATKYFHEFCRNGAGGFYRKSTGKAVLLSSVSELLNDGNPVDPLVKSLVEQGSSVPNQFDLTKEEIEVLVRLDLRNKEITQELGLDLTTIENRVESITTKLEAKTRTGAALKAVQIGYKLLPILPGRDPATGNSHEYLQAFQHAIGEIERHGL